ncbi:MAG: hypothetical protein M1830_001992 [Pleopsidium flavum]|nr:MAG: hypothetical protein M1830_001992 [Pleopsidium flavum]
MALPFISSVAKLLTVSPSPDVSTSNVSSPLGSIPILPARCHNPETHSNICEGRSTSGFWAWRKRARLLE